MKRIASTQLGTWIRLNKKLKADLKNAGFTPGKKLLTPKQVELIVSAIGEP